VSIAVARSAPRTVFVALHEPFENAASRIGTFRRIQQTEDAVAVAVIGRGAGVNDRLMVRVGDRAGEPITLAGGGESFTFVGHACLRVGDRKVEARGDLRAIKLHVTGRPALVVNGQPTPSRVSGGLLVLP
jgi:hypothetical protein